MRINRFVALASGCSRRQADALIAEGRVSLNGRTAIAGNEVKPNDTVTLDGKSLHVPVQHVTLLLNKPAGYVTSRRGQGSRTVYDLLPKRLHGLKPVGRLDKESSGLLLMTTDGNLAYRLTHPSFQKPKVYEVTLDKPLTPADRERLEAGTTLDDGLSRLQLHGSGRRWTVRLHEGRNRQIRRTFAAAGYRVMSLNRRQFGDYTLGSLPSGQYRLVISKNTAKP